MRRPQVPGRERARELARAPATGVAAIVLVFLATSAWWLLDDVSMVNVDNAKHINIALQWREAILSGDLLEPLRLYNVYPPGTHIVGALGTFVFGYSAGAVVMAQNVVFVPLLALGCYGTAKVAFGREAGLLAALFAFAVPMVLSLFHQALPDTPMAAMVALTVWLLLASDRFARPAIAAAAGVAAGLGMYAKGTFVVFIAGVVLVMLVRGGWRRPKGSLLFAGLATVIAAPYFIDQFSAIEAQSSGHLTSPTSSLPLWYGNVTYPHRTSVENFTWYFWNLVNNQLYLPLTLFFLAGVGWALVRLLRSPRDRGYLPELFAGGLVGYLAVSLLVLKDPRYTLPCLVYIAVIATAWIPSLRRRWRIAAVGALGAVAIFNGATQLGGIGGVHSIDLPNAVNSPIGEYRFTWVNELGFFGGPPSHAGRPIVAMLDRLTRRGVTNTIFDERTFSSDGYHLTGLTLLGIRTEQGMPGFTPDLRGQPEHRLGRAREHRRGRPRAVPRVAAGRPRHGAVHLPRPRPDGHRARPARLPLTACRRAPGMSLP